MEEYFVFCPYCGAEISLLSELSRESQTYREDGEVCGAPIALTYQAGEAQLVSFPALTNSSAGHSLVPNWAAQQLTSKSCRAGRAVPTQPPAQPLNNPCRRRTKRPP